MNPRFQRAGSAVVATMASLFFLTGVALAVLSFGGISIPSGSAVIIGNQPAVVADITRVDAEMTNTRTILDISVQSASSADVPVVAGLSRKETVDHFLSESGYQRLPELTFGDPAVQLEGVTVAGVQDVEESLFAEVSNLSWLESPQGPFHTTAANPSLELPTGSDLDATFIIIPDSTEDYFATLTVTTTFDTSFWQAWAVALVGAGLSLFALFVSLLLWPQRTTRD